MNFSFLLWFVNLIFPITHSVNSPKSTIPVSHHSNIPIGAKPLSSNGGSVSIFECFYATTSIMSNWKSATILILAIEQGMSLMRLAVARGISFEAGRRWRKDFARGGNQGGRRGPELCACPQTCAIHLTSPPARTRGFSTIVQTLFDRLKRDPHGHPNKIHVL